MIKSIRILKNAVDLSMYGFAGSGGVIEIKTKMIIRIIFTLLMAISFSCEVSRP